MARADELKNEAEELYKDWYAHKLGAISIIDVICKIAEPREKRIAELETRCTELFLQNNEFAERFEKSIEIIKSLLPCCRNYPQENAEKMKQAKQFLKDLEK